MRLQWYRRRAGGVRALAFVCAALAGCAQAPRSDAPAPRVDAARADAAVGPYVGKEVPGMVVAVGYHGRLLFEKAYGKADLRSGARMTPRTHLEIGSMTKEMTSAALLTLARDGRLAIDNDVNVLLPQYTYGNRMTLRQLSTMSSGLQGAATNGDAIFGIVNPDTRFTPAEIYKRLNATPPIHPPNTIFESSSRGPTEMMGSIRPASASVISFSGVLARCKIPGPGFSRRTNRDWTTLP